MPAVLSDHLCECGCGQPTKVAARTDARRGWVKGQPIRFVHLHQPRARGPRNGNWNGGRTREVHGYVMLMTLGHPGADGRGYVKEHILDAELAMQKEMPPGAGVHHVNGVKDDNRNSNYVVCDQTYHMLLHIRQKALEACGNPAWRRCWLCDRYDDPANLTRYRNSSFRHAECFAGYLAEWKRRRGAA